MLEKGNSQVVVLSRSLHKQLTDSVKQLSPTEVRLILVENIGVEPMTFWLPAKRSSQLS